MNKCWCGNKNLREYAKNYLLCEQCGTLISKYEFNQDIYNVKDEQKDLYGKNYWEVSMEKAIGTNNLEGVIDSYLNGRVIYWMQYILKYIKLGGSIVEVGCGLGQLQYVLKRLGYTQKAYELSKEICSYIKKNMKISVCCGNFRGKRKKYDGILAFDLFEHLIDPDSFLKKCMYSLTDTGVLCIQTPCFDPQLTFEDMVTEKRKFINQLKWNQHVYLYSKNSIEYILHKYGFNYIKFEPAYFGNDYDMFLFASKKEILSNTSEEIDDFLNHQTNGRLLKTMIQLFENQRKMNDLYNQADIDRRERLTDIEILTKQLKDCEKDRKDRLDALNKMTELYEKSEEKCKEKDELIKTLTEK